MFKKFLLFVCVVTAIFAVCAVSSACDVLSGFTKYWCPNGQHYYWQKVAMTISCDTGVITSSLLSDDAPLSIPGFEEKPRSIAGYMKYWHSTGGYYYWQKVRVSSDPANRTVTVAPLSADTPILPPLSPANRQKPPPDPKKSCGCSGK
jgi:hypothetical protein